MAEDTKQKAQAVTTVSLTIDGHQVTVPKGITVLKAATDMGIHIPTFCWHPKLKSVGACRMCYVEIEKMPKLQVSCATDVMEGMVVYTASDQVKQGRKAIIEFILLNHPLDCPTCDKGGECDLQNLTFDHGYDDTNFDFQKYRFKGGTESSTFDDLKIGPEIMLNRNRCILCYKCVRANKEAFGEYDLGAYERGNMTEINAAPGEQVDNPFSGNLVEICPVGALTNSDWRYKIRVWLTETVPSICNYTSSGINTLFYKERNQNKIFRTTSRVHDDIDDGWLPDITRYGYQIVNSTHRLKTPLIKKEGKQVEATWDEALSHIHKRFSEIKDQKGSVCIGGLIAPNQDNASLHSFSKFFRTVIKSNNIDFRTHYRMLPGNPDSVYTRIAARPFQINEIENSDVIVSFGSDLLREHQNEYLRIRKAKNFGSPKVYSFNPYGTKASDVADLEMIYSAGTDESALNAICLAAIEENLVDSTKANELKNKLNGATLVSAAAACGIVPDEIKIVARALAAGKKITFMAGEIVARSMARETISSALANIVRLFDIDNKGQLAILARYSNSVGAEWLGLLPEPTGATKQVMQSMWGSFPESEPRTTDSIVAHMKKEEVNGCFLIGVNPIMLYPDREFAREGLEKLEFMVACDLFETETTALADVVLPLANWAEYSGDYINLEGRSQRAEQAVKPAGQAKPAHEIISLLSGKFENDLFESDSACTQEIEKLLAVGRNCSLPNEFLESAQLENDNDPDYPHPLFICDDAHHTGHLTERAASLANFAGQAYIELSPGVAEKYGLRDGDSVRVESRTGKIIAPAKISDFIDSDVVVIPRNFSSTQVTSLLMRKLRIDRVKLTKVEA